MLSTSIGAFVMFVLGFGFLVFVHELGHFLVARLCGVRCPQFAIGFGHALLSYRKGLGLRVGSTEKSYYNQAQEKLTQQGENIESLPEHERLAKLHAAADEMGLAETEYRLNYLPLGGYVKMVGQEDLDPNAKSSDPRAYNNKSIFQRMCIISAGVVMNLIFGLLFFIVAFSMGVNFPGPTVGSVSPGSPASKTYAQGHDGDPNYLGLKSGDTVIELDGKPVRDMVEIRVATALGKPDKVIELKVDRPGEEAPLTFNVIPEKLATIPGEPEMLAIGISPGGTLRVHSIREDSDIYQAGVEPGMSITHVDGQPVTTYAEFSQALAVGRGEPLPVTFAVVLDEDASQEEIEKASEKQPVTVPMRSSAELARSLDGEAQLLGLQPLSLTRVDSIAEDDPKKGPWPAKEMGMQAGDLIIAINDQNHPTWEDVQITIAESDAIALTVLRDGQTIELSTAEPRDGRLGFVISAAFEAPYIEGVIADSSAAELDLPKGSKLLAINGMPIETWTDFQRSLQLMDSEAGNQIKLEYELNLGDRPTAETMLTLSDADIQEIAAASWRPMVGEANLGFTVDYAEIQESNPVLATGIGLRKTKEFIYQTYITLKRLTVDQTVKVQHLRGPVGIVDEGQRIAQRGWSYLLFFLGLISINLAVLNFLPFPILDGGHMVFLGYEKITGSPPPIWAINVLTIGALVLLASLFLVITYHDIVRLVTGG